MHLYDVDLYMSNGEEQIQQIIHEEESNLYKAYKQGTISQSVYWQKMVQLNERYLTEKNKRKSLCWRIINFLLLS